MDLSGLGPRSSEVPNSDGEGQASKTKRDRASLVRGHTAQPSIGGAALKILVTGGQGFIGSHLVDRLLLEHQVVAVGRSPRQPRCFADPDRVEYIQKDIKDNLALYEIIKSHGAEVVYHIAWSNLNASAQDNIVEDIYDNVVTSVRLFEACLRASVQKIIYVSSGGTVYGIPQTSPVDEQHVTAPLSAYGVSKLAVENYLNMYSRFYGIESTIIRPSVPYGPRQSPLRGQGAIPTFLYRILRGEEITVWGDGTAQRDFFYIDDLITGLVACLTNKTEERIFNIAGDRLYTLAQIIEFIAQEVGRPAQIRYYPERKVDIPSIKLDTQRLTQQLHWQPQTSLPEGIAQTKAWIAAHYCP
jgi:UDP-glucose 4-epimerase